MGSHFPFSLKFTIRGWENLTCVFRRALIQQNKKINPLSLCVQGSHHGRAHSALAQLAHGQRSGLARHTCSGPDAVASARRPARLFPLAAPAQLACLACPPGTRRCDTAWVVMVCHLHRRCGSKTSVRDEEKRWLRKCAACSLCWRDCGGISRDREKVCGEWGLERWPSGVYF
jgi:hypothetical protein